MVRAAFAALPPGAAQQFLGSARAGLGGVRPRTALLHGRFEEVLRVAQGFIER